MAARAFAGLGNLVLPDLVRDDAAFDAQYVAARQLMGEQMVIARRGDVAIAEQPGDDADEKTEQHRTPASPCVDEQRGRE
jgi:hypothetical protein